MQHELIFVLATDRVNDLCITAGTERCDNDCLRLATRKHGRPVRARQMPNVTYESARTVFWSRPSIRGSPANNTLANRVFLQLVQGT